MSDFDNFIANQSSGATQTQPAPTGQGPGASDFDQFLSGSQTQQPGPSQAPAPQGSSDFDAFLATGKTSPLAAPQKQASSGTGGKGLSGFLGRAAGDVINVGKGLGPGIESMVMAPGRLALDTGLYAKEKLSGQQISDEAAHAPGFVNLIAHAATLGKLGNSNQQHLGDTNAGAENQGNTFIGGAFQGFNQTANEIAHPTQAVKNYSSHPVSSFLNDAANVSIVGGAAGQALKGVGEGVLAGTRAGAAAAKAGEVASQVSRAASMATGGPLLHEHVISPLLGRLADTDLGRVATSQLETIRARAQVAATQAETSGVMAADLRQSLGERTAEINHAVPDPTEQGASVLLAQGVVDAPGAAQHFLDSLKDPTSGPVIRESLQAYNDALESKFGASKAADLAVTPEMLQTAAEHRLGLGDSATAARLNQGEEFMRQIGQEHGELAQKAGVGGESFQGPQPKQSAVDQAVGAAPETRAAKLTNLAESLRQRVEDLGLIKPGQSLDEAHLEAKQSASALRRMAQKESQTFREGQPTPETSGAAAKAEEHAALLDQYKRATPLAEKAQQRLSTLQDRAANLIEAAPAPYKPALMHMRDLSSALSQAAERAVSEGDPLAAEKLNGVAADFEKFGQLASFENAETQPEYVRGGANKEPRPQGVAQSAREIRGGFTRQRATNVTETSFTGQAVGHLKDYMTYARNTFARAIGDKFGTSAAQLDDVRNLSHGDMVAEMRGRGLVPWDSKMQTAVPDHLITHDTQWVPEKIGQAAEGKLAKNFEPGVAGNLFDKATKLGYRNFLQLSPFYMAHMVGSDVVLAATHGMDLGDMVNYGRQAADWLRGKSTPEAAAAVLGDEAKVPGSLRGGKLDEQNFGKLQQPGLAKRIVQTAVSVPTTVDELTRVAMYLKNLDEEGMSHEEAVAAANKALGHLNNLGPIEQTVVRRIFPVYPWMKQVAEMVGKLASDHPQAAMFTMHAADQATARNEKGLPTFLQGFDPARLVGINPLNLVNPVIRAGAGAGLGLNLAAHRGVTESGRKTGQIGPMSGAGAEYFAAHQFPLGKLIQPLTQTPGYQRNDAGQLALGKGGQPKKSAYPNDFWTAVKNYLFGTNPSSPPPPGSALARSKAKTAASAAKSAEKQTRERSALAKRGIR